MEKNMNEVKRETRASTLNGVGQRMEVLHEAARIEVAQWQGAKQALHELTRKLEAHLAVVDRDAEDDKLDDAERAVAKRYVDQCRGIARNLAVAAEVQVFQAQGKVLAFDRALLDVKQAFDQTHAKATTVPEASAPREAGQHPGDALESRREEARQRRRKKKGNSHAKPGQEQAGAKNA